ncbi:MAG: UDP-2,3-diacylglucosamine diphosphatase [Bacteroidales bacterium]|nr:UDP-2,3-diacylglucosamine diphosphatase [Bacteroidales bacterium]
MNSIIKNKVYFASDLHLGAPDYASSLEREKAFVKWLDLISIDALDLYLLGDIFDMWFDYKRVVPRGYVRLLGKLAELSDAGLQIHYFIGNHDMWVFDYFEKELNAKIYREPKKIKLGDKVLLVGHGDGLGGGDASYKFVKRIFAGKFNQWLFARLHPNFGLWLASFLSRRSRIANGNYDEQFHGEEKEMLVQYCKGLLKNKHYDYFIFGHRHLKMEIKLSDNSTYINLGEWVKHKPYAVFDGDKLSLQEFK